MPMSDDAGSDFFQHLQKLSPDEMKALYGWWGNAFRQGGTNEPTGQEYPLGTQGPANQEGYTNQTEFANRILKQSPPGLEMASAGASQSDDYAKDPNAVPPGNVPVTGGGERKLDSNDYINLAETHSLDDLFNIADEQSRKGNVPVTGDTGESKPVEVTKGPDIPPQEDAWNQNVGFMQSQNDFDAGAWLDQVVGKSGTPGPVGMGFANESDEEAHRRQQQQEDADLKQSIRDGYTDEYGKGMWGRGAGPYEEQEPWTVFDQASKRGGMTGNTPYAGWEDLNDAGEWQRPDAGPPSRNAEVIKPPERNIGLTAPQAPSKEGGLTVPTAPEVNIGLTVPTAPKMPIGLTPPAAPDTSVKKADDSLPGVEIDDRGSTIRIQHTDKGAFIQAFKNPAGPQDDYQIALAETDPKYQNQGRYSDLMSALAQYIQSSRSDIKTLGGSMDSPYSKQFRQKFNSTVIDDNNYARTNLDELAQNGRQWDFGSSDENLA